MEHGSNSTGARQRRESPTGPPLDDRVRAAVVFAGDGDPANRIDGGDSDGDHRLDLNDPAGFATLNCKSAVRRSDAAL
jgi:hypothetical protein